MANQNALLSYDPFAKCGFRGPGHTLDGDLYLRHPMPFDFTDDMESFDSYPLAMLATQLSEKGSRIRATAPDFSYGSFIDPMTYAPVSCVLKTITPERVPFTAHESVPEGTVVFLETECDDIIAFRVGNTVNLHAIFTEGEGMRAKDNGIGQLIIRGKITNIHERITSPTRIEDPTNPGTFLTVVPTKKTIIHVQLDNTVDPVNFLGTQYSIKDANFIELNSDRNPEFSTYPTMVYSGAKSMWGYTQIIREPLGESRTKAQTSYGRLATTTYNRDKLQAYRRALHYIEGMLLFNGKGFVKPGNNGYPERNSFGFAGFLEEWNPDNILYTDQLVTGTYASAATPADYAAEVFNYALKKLFRFSKTSDYMAITGINTIGIITEIALRNSNYQVVQGQTTYGLDITTLLTPYGTIHFKQHKLLLNAAHAGDILFLDSRHLGIAELLPLQYDTGNARVTEGIKRMRSTSGLDGNISEYIGELGAAWKYPKSMMMIKNFGVTVPPAPPVAP